MGKKSKVIFTVFATILITAVVVLGACTGSGPEPSQPATSSTPTPEPAGPIKIGSISPITGLFSEAYPMQKAGAAYVVDQVNAAGGIMGREVVIVEKDSACTPEQGLLSAQALYDKEGIDLFLGDIVDGVNNALNSWAEDNEVVLISICGTRPCIAGEQKWSFHVGNNYWSVPQVVAQECVNSGAKKIFNVILEGQTETFDIFWDHMNNLDPSIENVGETWVGFTDVDFSPHITAALSSGADTVVCLLYGQFFVGFLLQAEGFGFYDKVNLMSIGHLDAEYTDPMGKDVPEGLSAIINMPWWLDTPEIQDFTSYYMEKTGGLHPGTAARGGYLSALMLLSAIEKAQSTDKEAVRSAMEGITIDTIIGKITEDPELHFGPAPIWWCKMGYVPEYPNIIVGVESEKHFEDVLPPEDVIREWKMGQ